MTVRAGPSVLNRVKRLAAFLAIVWGVAASFVVFDAVFLSGSSRLAEPGGALADLSLATAVKSSRLCQAEGDPSVTGPRVPPDRRVEIWMLGASS